MNNDARSGQFADYEWHLRTSRGEPYRVMDIYSRSCFDGLIPTFLRSDEVRIWIGRGRPPNELEVLWEGFKRRWIRSRPSSQRQQIYRAMLDLRDALDERIVKPLEATRSKLRVSHRPTSPEDALIAYLDDPVNRAYKLSRADPVTGRKGLSLKRIAEKLSADFHCPITKRKAQRMVEAGRRREKVYLDVLSEGALKVRTLSDEMSRSIFGTFSAT